MKLAGISGSLRIGSYNRGMLRAIVKSLPDGVTLDVAEFIDLPVYNFDVEQQGFPDTVERFREQLMAADGIVISTAEYNYSIPGGLKNAIDWMSRGTAKPFDGKPVMIVGASQSNYGTVRAQNHLRSVLHNQNSLILNKPEVLVTQAKGKFDENSELSDEATLGVLHKATQAFVSWVRAMQAMKAMSS